MRYIYLLFAFFLLFAACGKPGDPSKDKPKKDRTAEMVPVVKNGIADYIEETGEIQPRSVVKVKFDFTGRVVKLFKEQGDPCGEDEALAMVVPDINQLKLLSTAEITYKKALADLSQASNELAESEGLFRAGLIPRAKYDSIRDSFQIAEDEAEKARLELASLRENGRIEDGKGVYVRSPIKGTVVNRLVDLGDYIIGATAYQSGTVLFEVADIRDLILEAKINEMDILDIRQDAVVGVTIEALKDSNFTGKVFRVFPRPEVIDNVKKYKIQVLITTALPDTIKPGMSCKIKVLTVEKKDVLVLPVGSVIRDDAKKRDYCLVTNTNGGAWAYEKKTVRTGARDLDRIEILDGLALGSRVVKNPYEVLDSLVRPDPDETNRDSGGNKRPRMRF